MRVRSSPPAPFISRINVTQFLIWYVGLGIIFAIGLHFVLLRSTAESVTPNGIMATLRLAWLLPVTAVLLVAYIAFPEWMVQMFQLGTRQAEGIAVERKWYQGLPSAGVSVILIVYTGYRIYLGI